MASDPKARNATVAYTGGHMTGAIGLLEWMFEEQPTWGAGNVGTTQLGRKRYKYGTRQRSNAAAGRQVFLDFGSSGTYSVRVSGDVVDFMDKIVPKIGSKLKRAYTRRGTIYAPTFPGI